MLLLLVRRCVLSYYCFSCSIYQSHHNHRISSYTVYYAAIPDTDPSSLKNFIAIFGVNYYFILPKFRLIHFIIYFRYSRSSNKYYIISV